MRLVLVILFLTIGLGLCLSQDNDELIVDYVAELNERSVVLPSGLNGRELCFYQRVPSYWVGTWELVFYHMYKNNPHVSLIVSGPYKDDGWETGDHPNTAKSDKYTKNIETKIFPLCGVDLVGAPTEMVFYPGIYSLCFRNENARSVPVVVWFDLNHEPNAPDFPVVNNGPIVKGSRDEIRHDMQLIRRSINQIESMFYHIEKNQILSENHSDNRYLLLSYAHMRIAVIYIFEICLLLGVTVGQILVVKTWFWRR